MERVECTKHHAGVSVFPPGKLMGYRAIATTIFTRNPRVLIQVHAGEEFYLHIHPALHLALCQALGVQA